jgi:quercetin dioxygenase-like cupin family protein
MAYHVVDSADIEPREGIPGDHRYIESVVDLGNLSMQVVEAEPGEDFAPYHYHEVQEEVFFVVSGVLRVETPDGVHDVEAGSFFVAEPEDPLHPHVPEDAPEPTHAVLVNAPQADDFVMYDPDE